MTVLTFYARSAVSIVGPLLHSPFGCMMACGVVVFMLSTRMSSLKASRWYQALAFVIYTAGSVMIVKGIAEAYQH
jgi:hypothetical protein